MNKVIHYTNSIFLENTENWIYEQIKNNTEFTPIVYAKKIINSDIYPIQKTRSFLIDKNRKNPRQILDKISIKLTGSLISPILYLFIDKPDIIHCHFGNSGYNFLLQKKIKKIPMITTFYGFDLSLLPQTQPEWRKKYKKLFKHGDKFLVEGNHMKKTLAELGCPSNKIIVFNLGVDLKNIKFKRRSRETVKEVKILISARFTEKKGIPYALTAVGTLINQNPNTKISITLIGDANDSDESQKEKIKIKETIKKYNLEKHIKLLGNQPHSVFLEELYKHHIFLHPSITASSGDTEGGAPVSMIEAAASGMPTIATEHCDIPEVILNKKTGYLVPEKNTEKITEKLKYLIDNPEICSNFGLAGRKHIEKNYNSVEQGKKLSQIYKKEINKN